MRHARIHYLLNNLILLEHHISRNVDIMMDRPTYLIRDREGWSCPTKQWGHDREWVWIQLPAFLRSNEFQKRSLQVDHTFIRRLKVNLKEMAVDMAAQHEDMSFNDTLILNSRRCDKYYISAQINRQIIAFLRHTYPLIANADSSTSACCNPS